MSSQPKNVFDWEAIRAVLEKERGPHKLPVRKTFQKTAKAVLDDLDEKKISHQIQLRDCRQELEKTEYSWNDVPTEEALTTEREPAYDIMPIRSITRRMFFRLCEKWILSDMQDTGAVEGAKKSGSGDWVWVEEKTL
ncbi:hypothetical protein QBC40DRAFT_300370 [Triangularia verruculosa]|uniref:Uncharacterized protein n=1 Tax=Triangularia verruculosa TaxID=2587418 RepID=A0AAN7APG5_9PEZI|nr:hypothetical protein QBC40DRAFT_300370 [Triangularia verruculosa]